MGSLVVTTRHQRRLAGLRGGEIHPQAVDGLREGSGLTAQGGHLNAHPKACAHKTAGHGPGEGFVQGDPTVTIFNHGHCAGSAVQCRRECGLKIKLFRITEGCDLCRHGGLGGKAGLDMPHHSLRGSFDFRLRQRNKTIRCFPSHRCRDHALLQRADRAGERKPRGLITGDLEATGQGHTGN